MQRIRFKDLDRRTGRLFLGRELFSGLGYRLDPEGRVMDAVEIDRGILGDVSGDLLPSPRAAPESTSVSS